MELTLSRKGETPNSTYGELKHGDKHLCFVIEDGHREVKEKGKTRIPTGRYKVGRYGSDSALIGPKAKKLLKAYNERWAHTWIAKLERVPGFDGILIHTGNTPKDTEGCLLPNTFLTIDYQTNQYEGSDSRVAYQKLYNYLDPIKEDIFITITDPK